MANHKARPESRAPRSGPASLLVVATVLLTMESKSNAYSIRYPMFSAPLLHEGRLVVASPNHRRVLCIGLNGTKIWERAFDSPVNLFSGPNSEPLVQVGKAVNLVSSESGELRPKFSVESEDDLVTYSAKLNSFTSQDRRFHPRMFKLLDDETGQPVWRTSEVEKVISATPELIVCLAVERIPSGPKFTYGSASLEAYERGSFKKQWSIPLPEDSGAPFIPADFQAPYLIYADGPTSLSVIDIATGRKQFTKQLKLPEYGRIAGLTTIDGRLAWRTYRMNRDHPDETEHVLRFLTVPDLKEEETAILKVIEIAHVSFEGGFIISDALYRTACFRPEGEKLWERFQNNRSPVSDGRIYFADYHRETARIGIIEVNTGKETILYTEPVKKPDFSQLFQSDEF